MVAAGLNHKSEASATQSENQLILELMSPSVIKRDGSVANLDLNEIRNAIAYAVEGYPLNSLELESRVNLQLNQPRTTKFIQETLVNTAVQLATPKDPEWLNVAGRLHIWNWSHEVIAKRGYGYGYYDVFSDNNLFSKYTNRLKVYSQSDLQEAVSWIEPELDKVFDHAGATLLTQRYLSPDELIQEVFLVTALVLAIPERMDERMSYARDFYMAIANRKISLATPILANLRFEGGSGTSCFILSVEDSINSIFDNVKNTARISQEGGGVGVNLSRIRAVGSWVRNKPNVSGGLMSWIRIFNDTAIAVNQGG